MLTEEQAKNIKEQLLKQIENFPPEQKDSLKEQIEVMNSEELENFLVQNKLMKEEGGKKTGREECVFCSILQGKVPVYKIDENKTSIAVLEINPLSPGHSLIVSKKHSKLASSSFSLANKIASRIKRKLKAQEVKIENASLFGHQLINIIPIYKDQKLEKKKLDERELILLQDKLKAKPRKKREKPVQQIPIEKLPKAKIRIP